MKLNPLKVPVSSLSGLAGVLIFFVLVIAAIARFPPPFSPLDNWMSDLGNGNYNPEGAAFFNSACVIAGLLAIVFYAGLYRWYSHEAWRDTPVVLGQIAGVVSGVSLVMVGCFPETSGARHYAASAAFFVSSSVAMLLINAGLYKHSKYDRATACVGLAAVAVSMVFIVAELVSAEIRAFEWLSVLLMLLWAGLLAGNMYDKFT